MYPPRRAENLTHGGHFEGGFGVFWGVYGVSAKTLEEEAAHHARVFAIVGNPPVFQTAQDEASTVAVLKRLG
jgi:hypothetical protein